MLKSRVVKRVHPFLNSLIQLSTTLPGIEYRVNVVLYYANLRQFETWETASFAVIYCVTSFFVSCLINIIRTLGQFHGQNEKKNWVSLDCNITQQQTKKHSGGNKKFSSHCNTFQSLFSSHTWLRYKRSLVLFYSDQTPRFLWW